LGVYNPLYFFIINFEEKKNIKNYGGYQKENTLKILGNAKRKYTENLEE